MVRMMIQGGMRAERWEGSWRTVVVICARRPCTRAGMIRYLGRRQWGRRPRRRNARLRPPRTNAPAACLVVFCSWMRRTACVLSLGETDLQRFPCSITCVTPICRAVAIGAIAARSVARTRSSPAMWIFLLIRCQLSIAARLGRGAPVERRRRRCFLVGAD